MKLVNLPFALLLLSGCQPSNTIDRAEFERLQTRVAQLDERVAILSEQQAKAKPPAPTATSAQPAVPKVVETPKSKANFQLIGLGNQAPGPLRYASSGACEEAKAAMLNSWNEQDNRNRERGIYNFRPTLTCLPVQ